MDIDIVGSGYNPAEVQASMGSTTLPNGLYLCKIKGAAQKATSAKTGHYLEMDWQVIEGEHAGAIVTDRLNLWNPNQTAVRIARQTFKAYAVAIGNANAVNLSEFRDKPIGLKVVVEQSQMADPETGKMKQVMNNRINQAIPLDEYRKIEQAGGSVGGAGSSLPNTSAPASPPPPQTQGQGQPPSGGQPPATGSPPADDDIPF